MLFSLPLGLWATLEPSEEVPRWDDSTEFPLFTFPEEEEPGLVTIKTVVIDPGHGGYEYGVVSGGYKEKDVVLDIAKRLKSIIERDLTRCFLTRRSDQFLSLKERADFSNLKKAEVFLSIHIGKHDSVVFYTPVVTGFTPEEIKPYLVNKGQEDFLLESKILQESMQQAFQQAFGEDVSVMPLPYSIMSKVSAAALMIELPSFDRMDYTEEYKTEIVNAIYRGLYLYEGQTAE